MTPMRGLAALVAIVALAACGSDEEQPAAPPLADLTVRVDPDGSGGKPAREAHVRCRSADESPACRAAAALKPGDLAPVPRDAVCTLQYGGPQTATIEGTLRGEPVDARFSRENGCEIARWRAVEPLLEAAR